MSRSSSSDVSREYTNVTLHRTPSHLGSINSPMLFDNTSQQTMEEEGAFYNGLKSKVGLAEQESTRFGQLQDTTNSPACDERHVPDRPAWERQVLTRDGPHPNLPVLAHMCLDFTDCRNRPQLKHTTRSVAGLFRATSRALSRHAAQRSAEQRATSERGRDKSRPSSPTSPPTPGYDAQVTW